MIMMCSRRSAEPQQHMLRRVPSTPISPRMIRVFSGKSTSRKRGRACDSSRRKYKKLVTIMESSSSSSDDEERENVNYIPMRPCHQRSKSLPFNHFKLQSASESSSRAAVDRKSSAHATLGRNSSQKSPASLKVSFRAS